MLFRLRNLPLAGATLLAILFLLAWLPGAAAGDSPSCVHKRLTVVAHEDDDLIFQNPAVLEAIAAGDCVRTVYVTAGDAGKGETYWRERELGPRAAYAQMAGVANSWTNSTPSVAGHTIHLATLTAHPQVSQVNLRLPDGGGGAGTGYAVNGNQSVPRLWRSQNPQPASLSPISSINAIDGSATYTYGGLLTTLEALIEEFEPDVIGTQNFSAEFGGGDHGDHIAVARFVHLAEASYQREHVLRSYMDYESKNQAQNVFEPALGKKLNAYYAYAVHDSNEACASQAACESPFYSEYWNWLKRQYVVTQRGVPGANAGSPQSVASQAQVTLDGSESSDPLGHSLSYEWTQTAGPAVTLSNAHAVKPTFTAPTGPATLTFSLVVKSSEASSAADSVTVTVAAPPKFTLTVSVSGNGSGTVTSSPAGIECPSDCEGSYTQGTKVTLTPTPAVGSEFKGWSGACAGSGSCEVTLGSVKSVGAEFALQRHQLSVTKSGTGSGTVTSSPAGITCGASCSASFDHGTEVTLSASPAAGSEFKGWSGACVGTGSCKVAMSAAKSVGAEFAPVPKFALGVSTTGNGSGTVTSSPSGVECPSDCEGSYEQGTKVTLTPASGAGSEFKGWSGACVGTGSCVVTMSAAKEVSAQFALELHQLSVTKSGTGSGVVTSSPAGINCGASCSASFDHGTEVTLSASPAAGSEFKGWSGACVGTGSCKVAMSAAKSVGAEFAPVPKFALGVSTTGNGSGTVTSSPSGVECPSDCEGSYEQGTKVTLTPASGAGSEFKGWSGACTGTGACEVSMTAAKSVGAEFALQRHQLTLTKSGSGSGTVTSAPAGITCGATCSASFDHGTEVTLSASPAAGSEFKGWSGACVGTGTCEVTMSAAKSVGAEFVLQRHQLSVTKSGAGNGTVTSAPAGINCGATCSASFDHGTEVTLSASPAAGSEFKGWSGACVGTGSCKVAMSAAKSVGAEFAPVPKFALNVSTTGNGSGTVTSSPAGISCGSDCEESYEQGTKVTLSPSPAAGSEFKGWSGACTGTGACEVSMTAAKSVGAEFVLQQHQLSVTKSGVGNGTVTSSPAGINCGATCSASFDHGTEVTLSATPAAGSFFAGWSGACSGAGSCKVSMSSAKSVGAEFAPVPKFALSVSTSGNGPGSVTSSPTGISCPADCEQAYEQGTSVTLTPAPGAGSEFKGWSGACVGTGSCVVTMSAAKEVSAQFALELHQLSVTKSGTGSGVVTSSPAGINCGASCSASFDHGTEVTLSATPAAGSFFAGWSGACSGPGSCKVAMSSAKSVGAEFAPVPKFALNVSTTGNGSGIVTSSPAGISCGSDCEESYEQGTKVTLSPSPAAGSEFKGWSGACTGTGACEVSMTAAKSVGAEFVLQQHQLSVTKSGVGNGTVTSSPAGINCGATCSASFDHGTEVTLSATPAAGSFFAGWSGACSGAGSCKVSMSSAKSVGAEFAPVPKFALNVSTTGNGSGIVTSSPAGISCGSDCEESYEQGTKVTLSPSPAAGSEFKGWSGACTGTGACEVSMTAAKSVGAEFVLQQHQLSVTKSGVGNGTVTSSPAGINCGATCSASFDHGTEVTLSATPAAGSFFAGWSGACSGAGSCKVSMSSAKSVGAEFAPVPKFALNVSTTGNGSGIVTSSPAGISCGSDCEESYEQGTKVTLSPSPAAGSEFKGWSGACVGTGTCEVTMSTAKSVGAEFALQRHQLTVTKSGSGSGTVTSAPAGINCGATCSASFDHGTEVTLSANPTAGSEFKGWSGSCTGTGSCKVSMSAAKSVGAEFAPVPKFALSVSTTGNGSGSVTSSPTGINCPADCEQAYEQGTSVTLTPAPGAGSEFKGWSGACVGTGSCVVTMSAAKEVSAQFALELHQLSVTKSGTGSGVVTSSPAGINCGASCSASFDHGTEVTLSANPAAGSTFIGWSGAGCSGTGNCVVSMSAAKEISAQFALETHPLTVTKSGTGSGVVTSSPAGINCGATCSASFDHGTEVTLSASPAAGSEFKGWTGACAGTGACEVTMSTAKSVGAEFALQRHQLTVTKAGAGNGTVTSAPAGISCGATCAASFDHGSAIKLTAAPAAESEPVVWTGCDQVNGADECELTMGADEEVTATFTLINHNPLTVTKIGSGTGTVTSSLAGIDCGAGCTAEYLEGTVVSLTGAAGAGSKDVLWETCPGTVNASNQCEVTMSQARNVTARFDLEQHALVVTTGGTGSGTVLSSPSRINCGSECVATFNHGAIVTLVAAASTGETVSWSGCDEVRDGKCTVAMDADRQVAATFAHPPAPPAPSPTPSPGPLPEPPEPPPVPQSPNTKLLKAQITQGTVKFAFEARGTATKFRCAIAKIGQKLRYKHCTSPVTFRRLEPGRYVFKVKAVGPGGADPKPITRHFRIASPVAS